MLLRATFHINLLVVFYYTYTPILRRNTTSKTIPSMFLALLLLLLIYLLPWLILILALRYRNYRHPQKNKHLLGYFIKAFLANAALTAMMLIIAESASKSDGGGILILLMIPFLVEIISIVGSILAYTKIKEWYTIEPPDKKSTIHDDILDA